MLPSCLACCRLYLSKPYIDRLQYRPLAMGLLHYGMLVSQLLCIIFECTSFETLNKLHYSKEREQILFSFALTQYDFIRVN